jgi:hypothetical protein
MMTYSHYTHNNEEDENLIAADDDRYNRKDSVTTPIDFNPTFYNPFEIKHRRRISREQFKKLEKAFIDNPKPNGKSRQKLAENVAMSARGVQVWFQNRRAKAKQQKENKKKQDKLPESSSRPAVEPVLFSPYNMVHSRSQSSSSSSISFSDSFRNSSCFAEDKNALVVDPYPSVIIQPSHTWNSDASTVTGADDDDIKVIQSPFTPVLTQVPSHQFASDTDFSWMNNTIMFETPNESYVSMMDRGQLFSNVQGDQLLDAWAYMLPPNNINQPTALNSRYLGNELAYNRNVADWIKTVSLAQSCNTEKELLDKIQTGSRGFNFNEEFIIQDDAYWAGQQVNFLFYFILFMLLIVPFNTKDYAPSF